MTTQLAFDIEDVLESQFRRFHFENPHVLPLLVQAARELKAAGRSHGSIEWCYCKLRWDSAIRTGGEPMKLNDRYTSRYSRLIMQLHPDLDGFFRARPLAADRRTA